MSEQHKPGSNKNKVILLTLGAVFGAAIFSGEEVVRRSPKIRKAAMDFILENRDRAAIFAETKAAELYGGIATSTNNPYVRKAAHLILRGDGEAPIPKTETNAEQGVLDDPEATQEEKYKITFDTTGPSADTAAEPRFPDDNNS